METKVRNENIQKIINAEHSDPFSVLGIHKIKQGNEITFVIRAYYPNSKSVKILIGKKEYEMDKISLSGFYEYFFNDKKDFFIYKFKITDNSNHSFITSDPYSFLPVLTDFDSNLFVEGNHDKIYDHLGSNEKVINNISGTHFALWAPNAVRVSIVGDFNQWDGRRHQCRRINNSGIWEIFIPMVQKGDLYKYEIKTPDGELILKSDPFSFYSEHLPNTASVVETIPENNWTDDEWILQRKTTDINKKPISIYELHLDSWKKEKRPPYSPFSYRKLVDELIPYVKKHSFTHIELIEFIDNSFSINNHLGTIDEFIYFINQCHINNIGVILDWNISKPIQREGNLYRFDGTHLYENKDGLFKYNKKEIENFIISNALFWLDKYHIDGLKINIYEKNSTIMEIYKRLNMKISQYHPGVITIARDNANLENITTSQDSGGFGFSFKWNIDWKNTLYKYIGTDPIYRKHSHNDMVTAFTKSFTENYILPLSHDDFSFGKSSLINKIHGDYWQKFATLRALFSYMIGHPGKKLFFMGSEFGQFDEWSYYESLDWNLHDFEMHEKLQTFFKDLNRFYSKFSALNSTDLNMKSFEWINNSDSDRNTISFTRKYKNTELIFISNFSPVVHESYRIGVDIKTFYEEVLNSDSEIYGGSNVGNLGGIHAEDIPYNEKPYSINLRIPPLATLIIKPLVY